MKNTKLSQAKAEKIIDILCKTIISTLKNEEVDAIRFTGFGSFLFTEYKARTRKLPNSSEVKYYSARKKPKFKFIRQVDLEISNKKNKEDF